MDDLRADMDQGAGRWAPRVEPLAQEPDESGHHLPESAPSPRVTTDALDPQQGERAARADGVAPAADGLDLRHHTERLGRLLAELYNENTLLRERVRTLENGMRAPSERG